MLVRDEVRGRIKVKSWLEAERRLIKVDMGERFE
jgi:hypothetical protein